MTFIPMIACALREGTLTNGAVMSRPATYALMCAISVDGISNPLADCSLKCAADSCFTMHPARLARAQAVSLTQLTAAPVS